MFGFRRRERPPIQLYGKLPLAKDYLRLGLGDGAGLALRDWLDRTYSTEAHPEYVPEPACAMRFVIGDVLDGTLQGVLRPSSDAGGLRPFPFVICVERKKRVLLEEIEGSFAQSQRLWSELDRRFRKCAEQPDGQQALATLRGQAIDVDELPDAEPSHVALDAWLDALWPDAGRDGLERFLTTLHGPVRGDANRPIRLPLAAGLPTRDQVGAWLEILTRLSLHDGDTLPTAFFPQSASASDAPFVTVFRAPLDSSHAAWLAPATEQPLGLGDLASGHAPAAGRGADRPTHSSLAASLRSTLTGFVGRLQS